MISCDPMAATQPGGSYGTTLGVHADAPKSTCARTPSDTPGDAHEIAITINHTPLYQSSPYGSTEPMGTSKHCMNERTTTTLPHPQRPSTR